MFIIFKFKYFLSLFFLHMNLIVKSNMIVCLMFAYAAVFTLLNFSLFVVFNRLPPFRGLHCHQISKKERTKTIV